MAKHYLTVRCTEENCKECSHYIYDSKKEYNEAVIRHRGYKCLKHSERGKDTLMSVDVLKKQTTLVNSKSKNTDGLYWADENGKLKSGYQHGPGFQLWSKDFPEGAILKIKAEVILPKSKNTNS